MEWDTNYENGIIWQDLQHKELIESMLHLLNSIVEGNQDKDSFYKTIKFVKHYYISHFLTEEKYMIANNYPLLKDHLAQHKYFINEINSFISQCIFQDMESSVELLNKLTNWFYFHIQHTDKQLAKFLLKNECHGPDTPGM
jgi:hemerythrin